MTEDFDDDFTEAPLGHHKGRRVLSESAQISKGARVLSDTMDITPFDVEPGDHVYLSMEVVQRKERFDTVMSEDEPDKVLGFHRVVIFDAVGAVRDTSAQTVTRIEKMKGRIADKAEKTAAEKKGQFRMPGVETVDPDA